jgi:hypothetical protein
MNHVLLNRPLSLADEPLDGLHILACERTPYLSVRPLIEICGKGKWFAKFQERPFDCCKDPANVDIEAWWSCDGEREKGTPDIYKLHCRVCEEKFMAGEIRAGRDKPAGFSMVAFCVGGSHPDARKFGPAERPDLHDQRPFWEVR